MINTTVGSKKDVKSYLNSVNQLPHHQQEQFCLTRAKYRQGHKLTATKVYTISQESKYLIIQGVPSINLKTELYKLCSKYGKCYQPALLENYPREAFTDTFLINFKNITQARIAKRKLDNYNYYGGILHVCYAPELESVEDTLEKLIVRQQDVYNLLKDEEVQNFNKDFEINQEKKKLQHSDKNMQLHQYNSKKLKFVENDDTEQIF